MNCHFLFFFLSFNLSFVIFILYELSATGHGHIGNDAELEPAHFVGSRSRSKIMLGAGGGAGISFFLMEPELEPSQICTTSHPVSRSRRSRYILPGAGAGDGAAGTFCSEPEPEPNSFPGLERESIGTVQNLHGSASLHM